MSEDKHPLLVLITAPDLAAGRSLAKALLARRIAACVNIVPGLVSLYNWENELHEDQEVLLMVKTRDGLLESDLIPLVQELHPYDLPEIIGLPITKGSPSYLDWIIRSTSGRQEGV
jgi:periplasmic divalent cation tolerance protein